MGTSCNAWLHCSFNPFQAKMGKLALAAHLQKRHPTNGLHVRTKSEPNSHSILGGVISARDQSVHRYTLMRVGSIFRS